MSLVPTEIIFEVTNLNSSGEGSLAWAISQVNSYTGDLRPVVQIDSSLAGQSIALSSAPTISKPCVVRGNGVSITGYAIKTTAAVEWSDITLPQITLSGAGALSGENITLTSQRAVYLENWSSAADFSGIKTTAQDAYIGISGTLGDSTFTQLPDTLPGGYRVVNDVTVAAGKTVTLEEGVCWKFDYKKSLFDYKESLYIYGTFVVNNATVADALVADNNYVYCEVENGGKLQLTNANLKQLYRVYLYSGGTLEMTGGTLDSRYELEVCAGATATLTGVTVKDYINNYGCLTLEDCSINSYINNYGCLTLEDCSINKYINSEGTLKLTDVNSTSYITAKGSTTLDGVTCTTLVVDGDADVSIGEKGIVLTGTKAFELNGFSGNVDTLLNSFEWTAIAENAYIGIGGMLGDCTFTTLPESVSGGYRFVGNATVSSGKTLTLEEGVCWELGGYDLDVYGTFVVDNETVADALKSESRYAYLYVRNGGKLQLTNANLNQLSHVYIYSGSTMEMTGGTLYSSLGVYGGATATLTDVNSTSYITAKGSTTLDGVTCTTLVVDGDADVSIGEKGIVLTGTKAFELNGFSGNVDTLLNSFEWTAIAGNAYIGISGTLGDSTFTQLPDTLPGGYRVVDSVTVDAGKTVTMEDGVCWKFDYKTSLYIEGTFVVNNATVAGALVGAKDVDCYVRYGGKLQLTNANLNQLSHVYIYSGSTLEMTGGTLDLWDGRRLEVRDGATATLTGVTVMDDIKNYGSLEMEDCSINNDIGSEGTLKLTDVNCTSYITAKGSSFMDGVTCATLVVDGDADVSTGENGIVLTGTKAFVLSDFSGNVDTLLNSFEWTAIAENAYIGIGGMLGDCTFTTLPESVSGGYRFVGDVSFVTTVTLEEGVCWELDGFELDVYGTFVVDNETVADALKSESGYALLYVRNGGKLQLTNANLNHLRYVYLYYRATLEMTGGTLDSRDYLRVDGGATATLTGVTVKDYIENYGSLVMDSCTVQGQTVTLYKGASASILNTSGISALTIQSGCNTLLTGNDFSTTKITLSGIGENEVIDLSGNYWGTTDIDTIISRISGYSEEKVLISSVLMYPPSQYFTLSPSMLSVNRVSMLSKKLTVHFNRVLDASTINAENIKLISADGTAVAITQIEVNGTGVTLYFEALERGQYRLEVSEAVKDNAGNSFRMPEDAPNGVVFESLFIDAPKVILFRSNTTLTDQFRYVDIFFDQLMDAATVTKDSIHIYNAQGQELKIEKLVQSGVAGNVFFRAYFDRVTAGGTYSVVVDTEVTSAEGMQMTEEYRHEFYISGPDLMVPDKVEFTGETLGRYTTITYSVKNAGDGLAQGSWTDNIYLCRSSEWNEAEAIFFGSVLHNDMSVAAGNSYEGVIRGIAEGLLSGEYYVFVKTDMSSRLGEQSETNNISASGTKITLGVAELAVGEEQTETLASIAETLYYQLVPTESGSMVFEVNSSTVRIDVQDGADGRSLPRYVVQAGNKTLVYFAAEAGKAYLLSVKGANPGDYTSMIQQSEFAVHGSSIRALAPGHTTTLELYGSAFEPGMSVYLMDSAGNILVPQAITVTDACTARVEVMLPESVEPGERYTLCVENSAGERVELSEDIIAADYASAIELTFRQGMNEYAGTQRVGWVWKTDLTVENKAAYDVENAIILIHNTAEDFAMYYSYDDAKVRDRSALLLLGGTQDRTKTTMTAGESEKLGVYVKHYRSSEGEIQAFLLKPEDTSLISESDWAYFSSAMHPVGVSDADWDAWWAEMQPRIGSRVCDFVSFIRDMQRLAAEGGATMSSSLADLAGWVVTQRPDYVPTATVSGVLCDPEGKARAGVELGLYELVGGEARLVSSVVTDENGAYCLYGLKDIGEYELRSSYLMLDEYGKGVNNITLSGSAKDVTLPLTACPYAEETPYESGIRLAETAAGQGFRTVVENGELRFYYQKDGVEHCEVLAKGDELRNSALYWAEKSGLLLIGWNNGYGVEADARFRIARPTTDGFEYSEVFDLAAPGIEDLLADLYVREDGQVVAVTEARSEDERTLTFYNVDADTECSWSSTPLDNGEMELLTGSKTYKNELNLTFKVPFVDSLSISVSGEREAEVAEDKLSATGKFSINGSASNESKEVLARQHKKDKWYHTSSDDTVTWTVGLSYLADYEAKYDCESGTSSSELSGRGGSVTVSYKHDTGLLIWLNTIFPKAGTLLQKVVKFLRRFGVKLVAGIELEGTLTATTEKISGEAGVTFTVGAGAQVGKKKNPLVKFELVLEGSASVGFEKKYSQKATYDGEFVFGGKVRGQLNIWKVQVYAEAGFSLSTKDGLSTYLTEADTRSKQVEKTSGILYQSELTGISYSHSGVTASGYAGSTETSAYVYVLDTGHIELQYFDAQTGLETGSRVRLDVADSEMFRGWTNVEYLSTATDGSGLVYMAAEGYFLDTDDFYASVGNQAGFTLGELIEESRCVETVVVDTAGNARALDQSALQNFSWSGSTYDVTTRTTEAELRYIHDALGMVWTSTITGSSQIYFSMLEGEAWQAPELLFSSGGEIKNCYLDELDDTYYVTFDVDYTNAEGYMTTTAMAYVWKDGEWQFTETNNSETAMALYRDYTEKTAAPVVTMNDATVRKVADGLVEFTLSWAGDDTYTYELTLDEDVYYLGSSTKFREQISDGYHTYSLKAIAGNGMATVTEERTVSIDATAPLISNVMAYCTPAEDGGILLNLNWTCSEDGHTSIVVDGQSYEVAAGSSSWSGKVNGALHTYSVTVTDKAGNTQRYSDKVLFNLSKPVVELYAPKVAASEDKEGISVVTFSWKGEGNLNYKLTVDGKEYSLGASTQVQLELADGTHSYSLTATGTNGQGTTVPGVLVTDASAPEIQFFRVAKLAKAGDGQVAVTLVWNTGEESTLTLIGDGKNTTVTGTNTWTLLMEDGKNSVKLKAQDASGNTSYATCSFNFDSTAPELKLYSPNVYMHADGTARAQFSWHGSDRQDITYSLYVNNSLVYTGSASTYSMKIGADISSWKVVAQDESGNRTEKTDSKSYAIPVAVTNLTAEAVKVEGKDGRIRLTLSWNSSAAAEYEVWINNRMVEKTSSLSFTTELDDGKYTYKIKPANCSGSKEASGSGVLDATAPVIRSLTYHAMEPQDGMCEVKLSWSSAEKAVYTLRFSDDTELTNLTSTSASVVLPTGDYTYVLTATDEVGNVSTMEGNLSVDADAAVAQMLPPQVIALEEGKSAITLAWTCDTPGAVYRLKVDGVVYNVGSKTEYTLNGCADGVHKYELEVEAPNGAVSLLTGTVETDATAPEIWASEPEVGEAQGTSRLVTFSWSSDDKTATYVVKVDGEIVSGDTPLTDNTFSCYVEDNTEDHLHSWQVIATDAFGNVAESISRQFEVDATAPVLTLDSVKIDDTDGKGKSTLAFRWSTDEPAEVYISVDGGAPNKAILDEFWVDVADGWHNYSIYAVDEHGNQSQPITGSIETDGTMAYFEHWGAQVHADNTVTISWRCDEACSYTVYADGAWHYFDSPSKTGSVNLGSQYVGEHGYTIIARDAFGNEHQVDDSFMIAPPEADEPDKTVTGGSFAGSSGSGGSWTDIFLVGDDWLTRFLSSENCPDKKPDTENPNKSFQSYDPNDLYGPQGYGAQKWVGRQEMDFEIVCENIPEENIAHAAMVTITQQIDSAFDYSTFRLGDMHIAGNYIEVEGDVQRFSKRVDWTSTLGVLVDVNARFDADTGIATWEFIAIDPETGYVVADPFVGLLAPNYNPPEGDGGVKYYVTPKATAATGTQFSAQADIIFDFNEPILTPTLSYTLDTDKPEAVVQALAAESSTHYLYINWQGTDVGSGISHYNVYVSVDGGSWQLWQQNIATTSALYAVQEGEHSYAFFAQAVDNVGNTEEQQNAAEDSTKSDYKPNLSSLAVKEIAIRRVGDDAVLTIEFTEHAQCADWTSALSFSYEGGVVDVAAGEFTYDSDSCTLTWTGSVSGVPDGAQLMVHLKNGTVTDAKGLPLGSTAPAYAAPVQLLEEGGVSYAAPTLVDYNGDGLTDLLVGENDNGKGKVRIYLNNGTAEVADFSSFIYATTAADTPLTVNAAGCQGAIVRMADLTGDGKAEMVVGQADGSVRVFIAAEDGHWTDAGLLTCRRGGLSEEVKVDSRAAVEFADMNGDGRVDMLIGTGEGNILLYLDAATTGVADFSYGYYLHDSVGRIDVGSRASVTACDVDGDGVMDLLVGSADGTIRYYHNEGSATEALFGAAENVTAGGISLDMSASTDRLRLDVADVNADGRLDILVGRSDGGIDVLYGADATTHLGNVVAGSIPQPEVLKDVQLTQKGSTLTLSWTATEGENITYEVRLIKAGIEQPVLTVLSNSAMLNVEDGEYTVQVRALNQGVAGDWCEALPVSVDTMPPSLPGGIDVQVGENSASFAWSAVEDAAAYELRYREAGGVWRSVLTEQTSISLDELAAADYEWQLRAVDAANNYSEWTEVQSITISGVAPEPEGETFWASGMQFCSEGEIVSGYYDVNKTGAADSNLCWAAAASNVLTWWQKQGNTTASVPGVPSELGSIYESFTTSWKNTSGADVYGFIWWLSGDSTTGGYRAYESSSYKGEENMGAWYDQYYTAQTVSSHTAQVSLRTAGATSPAEQWQQIYNDGGMITLGVFGVMTDEGALTRGHSLTLWGFSVNTAGTVTEIHVTDSDDGTTALVTLAVEYDAQSGMYRVADTAGSLAGYYLGNYSYLGAFTGKDIVAPTVQMAELITEGQPDGSTLVSFVWAASEANVLYTLTVDGEELYRGTATRLDNVKLKDGEHSYHIQAVDAAGNVGELSGTLQTQGLADNTVAEANVLTLSTPADGASRQDTTNWVGAGDAQDYYVFTATGDGSYKVGIVSSTLSDSLMLSVGTMENGEFNVVQNLLVSPDDAVSALDRLNLTEGEPYYISVSTAEGSSGSEYELFVEGDIVEDDSLITDNNTKESATQLELVSSSEATINSWVGAGDALDYYRLEMSENGKLTLSLTGLEANAKVKIYQDRGNGRYTQKLSSTAKSADGLDKTLSLTAGTYFIEVASYDNGAGRYNSSYTLELETQQDNETKRFTVANA